MTSAPDQLPSGKWRARWRANGQRYTRTFPSRTAAQAFLDQLHDGASPSELPRYDAWVAGWFRQHSTTVKPASAERYKKILNLYVIPHVGFLPLDHITPAVLRAWQSHLSEQGLSPATVKLARTVASMSLREAVIDGVIPGNPFDRVRNVKIPKKQVRILGEHEVRELADGIKPRWRAMVLAAAYCGLRIGELCALRSSEVDLDGSRLTVSSTRTKADGRWVDGPAKTDNSQRVLAIPKFVVAELELHVAEGFSSSSYFFTSTRGGPVQPDHFRKFPWATALRKTELGKLRVHDLRHTAVSIWIREGASPNLVAYRAGHGSVQYVLDTYGHLFGDEDLALAARMDAGRPI